MGKIKNNNFIDRQTDRQTDTLSFINGAFCSVIAKKSFALLWQSIVCNKNADRLLNKPARFFIYFFVSLQLFLFVIASGSEAITSLPSVVVGNLVVSFCFSNSSVDKIALDATTELKIKNINVLIVIAVFLFVIAESCNRQSRSRFFSTKNATAFFNKKKGGCGWKKLKKQYQEVFCCWR